MHACTPLCIRPQRFLTWGIWVSPFLPFTHWTHFSPPLHLQRFPSLHSVCILCQPQVMCSVVVILQLLCPFALSRVVRAPAMLFLASVNVAIASLKIAELLQQESPAGPLGASLCWSRLEAFYARRGKELKLREGNRIWRTEPIVYAADGIRLPSFSTCEPPRFKDLFDEKKLSPPPSSHEYCSDNVPYRLTSAKILEGDFLLHSRYPFCQKELSRSLLLVFCFVHVKLHQASGFLSTY